MPPLPFVPNVIKYVQAGTIASVPCANVFHVLYDSGGLPLTQASVQGLADGIRTAYVNRFRQFVATVANIQTGTAVDLSSATGLTAVAAGSTIGLDSAAALPANVSCCITWKTARHYRGGHPRTYIWGLTTVGPQNANTWNSGFLTTMGTAAAGFLADVKALTSVGVFTALDLCCVHYVSGGHLLTTPLVDKITSSVVDSRIDSQRRRLGKDR